MALFLTMLSFEDYFTYTEVGLQIIQVLSGRYGRTVKQRSWSPNLTLSEKQTLFVKVFAMGFVCR